MLAIAHPVLSNDQLVDKCRHMSFYWSSLLTIIPIAIASSTSSQEFNMVHGFEPVA